jgi:hypothetical protein
VLRTKGARPLFPSVCGLLAPLENREVVRVEDERHTALAFEFASTFQPAEANDLRKRIVPGELSCNLAIPGF